MENFDVDVYGLVSEAGKAREFSYSPYSHFAVGAAIVSKDGKVYRGANIENSSFPLCMCAERNAIYQAYLDGKSKDDLLALAVVADGEGPCSPCGACRQVLSELFPGDAPIYMANMKGDIEQTTIAELLPYAFDGSDL